MTSRVIVHAHCESSIQVIIHITNDPVRDDYQIVLQDRESHEMSVYGNTQVSVFEETK